MSPAPARPLPCLQRHGSRQDFACSFMGNHEEVHQRQFLEQRKMEETACEVICGSKTTPAVKG